MDQQTLIARVTAALADDQRIRGLFLSGSFGRGTADQYSDVDFWAVVANRIRRLSPLFGARRSRRLSPSSISTACHGRWC